MEPMNVPENILMLLRTIHELARHKRTMIAIVEEWLIAEGLNVNHFRGEIAPYSTEALTYLDYAEDDVEGSIDEFIEAYTQMKRRQVYGDE